MIDESISKNTKPIDISFPLIEKFDFLPRSTSSDVSAYVSIMEGCSKYCTFCVVPYTRGEEVSRPLDEILFEVSNLAGNGVREIILLGQNVNAYKGIRNRDKQPINFSELIRYISKIDGIDRIRHTTSHPIDFTDELIEEYNNTKLCSNLHLPVQSGSDLILSKMKRKHTALEYKNMIKKVRNVRPDISITSDFIIGYPGESNECFEETLDLIKQIGFDDGYSFIYSKRPGTPASSEPDNISMSEKKVNRIKEVKASDGFPVYEGKTSIQFTVNREDAGCGTGKAQTTQIKCDGKGNRSRQELHLGNMKLKNKEYIYEYAVYFDESYESLKKKAVVIIGQMHTDNIAKGCHLSLIHI
mgnify:CR=1 FL=1